ncbi:hypothetical protein DAPPUDRAFT_100258 [Daphnia pulex]|uniref:Uncharacterized protein n=1 Tax=Daphnia pulex TaxID=6669 RepID=E9G9W5_DAPPU|nr:hypothetical protein DAPPUDRAFT_100258 [Daphnia pulex]|eukprot:EFX83636.1 hypothetical protein DAPPUDRAFT_100258 [Daphnia pulex]
MAFGEFHPGFDIPESSQDDFRQVGSTDFYYGQEVIIPVTRSIATSSRFGRPGFCGTQNQLEESARIEDFMRVYEARFLFQAQLIRAYSNMPESIQRRHRANLYYRIQEETVFEHLLSTHGLHRSRPY